jgi:hypothetical protein
LASDPADRTFDLGARAKSANYGGLGKVPVHDTATVEERREDARTWSPW